jgi:hypothetical protein
VPARRIRLRYPSTCAVCAAELAAKTTAWWDGTAKSTRCENCGPDSGDASAAPVEAVPTAAAVPVIAGDTAPQPETKRIRVRYAGVCTACGTALPAGEAALYDRATETMRCLDCRSSDVVVADAAPPAEAPHAAPSPAAAPSRTSTAGGSAQREYERRKAKREDAIRSRHPRLGGLILALSDDPQSTTAWAKGAEGERRLGAGLDTLAEAGVVALHDRLIPGTRANIDHLAVAPSGVWVIDAKRYSGQVSKRDVGGWFSTDLRLYVGRRDCTKLVAAMGKQVAAVRAALGGDWADVPVRPVLCFIDAEWGWFARPFELDGVVVAWPKATRQLLVRPGPYTPDGIDLIAAHLENRLAAAS